MLTADDDLNTLTVGGHYLFFGNSIPQNAPTGLNDWTAYVIENLPYNELVTAQILHIIVPNLTAEYGKYSNCSLRRTRYGNTYTPWAWTNPPMELGVEYMTTERYMGRSVYKKLVALGEAPSTKGTKEIFPFGEDYNAGTYNVFSVDAHLSNSKNDGGWTITTPYFNINGELMTDIRFSGVRIDFYSTGQAGYYGFALLKYTKNTD